MVCARRPTKGGGSTNQQDWWVLYAEEKAAILCKRRAGLARANVRVHSPIKQVNPAMAVNYLPALVQWRDL
jgi:hypothetical protein